MKIDINNDKYPYQLKKIDNPPKQLYLKGNIRLLENPGIAIIGSRKCTKYGEKMTEKFAKELSLYGLTIISGMAEGVDSFAHLNSLKTTGNTIAVLPCGFNHIFPEKNFSLYQQILNNNGLILTEYEENEEADSKKFLERNRIVSGLAIGTLVIEGGYRSGTSVTARLTKKQRKNVFCIPSNLESPKGITPNKLIKEGAFLVTEVNDIICRYPEMNLKKHKINTKRIKELENQIGNEYKKIYDVLDKENLIHIDEIVKKLNIDVKEANYKLMVLELEGKVISLPGNNYRKK